MVAPSAMTGSTEAKGFTLLELIVVIAGLGILASLAIPNFIKYLQFAQIDEAKSLLNAAASECLQELRRSTDDSWKNFQPEALKARKSSTEGGLPALPANYQYQDGKNTCKEVQIYDPAGGPTIFPMLRFRIDASGRVYKDSQYFNDESKKDCESWGNCGGSESADYLIQCKADQKACEDNYSQFGSTQRDGGPWQVGKWRGACKWPRDPDAACAAIQVWTFEGKIVNSQAELDKLRADKLGAECTKKRNETIEQFNPPGEGIINLPDCKIYERHFGGSQLDCDSVETCDIAYKEAIIAKQAALAEKNKLECEAQKKSWIDKAVSGQFTPTISGCEAAWGCNESGTFRIYSSKADYDSSPCAAPPPPPAKVCRTPDIWYCPWRPTWQECQPICN